MKKINLLLVGLMILTSFFGCGLFFKDKKVEDEIKTDVKVEESTENEKVVMSYSEWPPDTIVFLASEKGFFKDHGVDVEVVFVEGYEDLFEKVDNGEIDIWNNTFFDLVYEVGHGADWQTILVEDFSYGADGIVVMEDSGIDTIADLKGKKVAVEMQTVGDFFLQILLERENLSADDLTLIDLSAEESATALINGEVDAAVTYEPYITETAEEGTKILTDSEREKGLIVDVLVANKNLIPEKKESYKKVILGWLDAVDYLNNDPEEAAEILKDIFGMTTEDTVAMFETFKIPNLRDNLTAFSRGAGFESLYTLGDLSKDYLIDQDMLQEEYEVDEIINDDLIKELNK